MPILLAFDWQLFGVLTAYSAAVVAASIVGGILPDLVRLTHTRMQLTISFVGGLMLGISIFHMIPHSVAGLGPDHIDQVMWGVMLGLLATFFLLRFFHFHQHGPADFGLPGDFESLDVASDGESPASAAKNEAPAQCAHPHHADEHPQHGHSHEHRAHEGSNGQAAVGHTRWLAVLVGLGLHTLLDGVALAAGVAIEAGHGTILPGFGIFMAVLLHKPLDAVSITSLMQPVSSPNSRMWVNVGFAMMCPVGALLFLLGAGLAGDWSVSMAAAGLAFSAGVFLCIALSDLLPEMEFHSHSRVPLTIALLLGILAAWAIGLAEGEHAHHHAPEESPAKMHQHPHPHPH
jgi:zinc and cadmium transporter